MNDEATHTPATRGVQDTPQEAGSVRVARGGGRGGQRGAGGAGLETLQGCDLCWPSAVPVSRHPRIPRGPTAWCVRSRQKCMRFCSEVYRRVSERDSLYHEENGGRWPSPGVSPQTLCPQQGRAAGQRSSNGNPVRVSKRARAARSSGSRPHVTANADGWVEREGGRRARATPEPVYEDPGRRSDFTGRGNGTWERFREAENGSSIGSRCPLGSCWPSDRVTHYLSQDGGE